MNQQNKNCITCNKIFYKKRFHSKKYWETAKYCSRSCVQLFPETTKKLKIRMFGNKYSFEKHWKHSKKVREKMKITNKGKNKHIKNGYKHSIETRKKLSIANIGKKQSIKVIANRVFKNTGKKRTKETIKKMSLSQIGKPRPYQSGEKSSNWKGGITPLNHRIRTCLQYTEWRRQIFRRDYWTCVMCNKKSGIKIEADHFPKQFHKINKEYNKKVFEQAEQCKELWDIKNGRT